MTNIEYMKHKILPSHPSLVFILHPGHCSDFIKMADIDDKGSGDSQDGGKDLWYLQVSRGHSYMLNVAN